MENNQNLAETIKDYKKQLISFYEKSLTDNFTPKNDDNNFTMINTDNDDMDNKKKNDTNNTMLQDSDNLKQKIAEKKQEHKDNSTVIIQAEKKENSEKNNMMNGYIQRNNMMKYGNLTPEQQYNLYKKEHPALGKLMVKTYTAKRTFPVENAIVEVSKTFPNGKYVIATGKTDQSGMTQTLLLPTKRKPMTLQPGETEPYGTYTVTITHPNFVTTRINDVPVFDETMSVQTVDLVPPSVNTSENKNEIIEYTAFRPNL